MRRTVVLAVVLFVLSVSTVLTGCEGSKPETGMIPPPAKEVKSKNGKTNMVIEKID